MVIQNVRSHKHPSERFFSPFLLFFLSQESSRFHRALEVYLTRRGAKNAHAPGFAAGNAERQERGSWKLEVAGSCRETRVGSFWRSYTPHKLTYPLQMMDSKSGISISRGLFSAFAVSFREGNSFGKMLVQESTRRRSIV